MAVVSALISEIKGLGWGEQALMLSMRVVFAKVRPTKDFILVISAYVAERRLKDYSALGHEECMSGKKKAFN